MFAARAPGPIVNLLQGHASHDVQDSNYRSDNPLDFRQFIDEVFGDKPVSKIAIFAKGVGLLT